MYLVLNINTVLCIAYSICTVYTAWFYLCIIMCVKFSIFMEMIKQSSGRTDYLWEWEWGWAGVGGGVVIKCGSQSWACVVSCGLLTCPLLCLTVAIVSPLPVQFLPLRPTTVSASLACPAPWVLAVYLLWPCSLCVVVASWSC